MHCLSCLDTRSWHYLLKSWDQWAMSCSLSQVSTAGQGWCLVCVWMIHSAGKCRCPECPVSSPSVSHFPHFNVKTILSPPPELGVWATQWPTFTTHNSCWHYKHLLTAFKTMIWELWRKEYEKYPVGMCASMKTFHWPKWFCLIVMCLC